MTALVRGRIAGGLAALVASACSAPDAQTPDIQVMGSAHIEKPAEIFRIEVQIVERNPDRLAALAAATAKLEAITAGVSGLDGLASYSISSESAHALVERPVGCDLAERNYYDRPPRPEDCSPIETAALLTFTLEGAPAEAAGLAVAFLTQADAETISLEGFDVADPAAGRLEAKQAALADAMSTARALADQAGVSVNTPSSIRYGEARNFNQDISSAQDYITVTGSRIARVPSEISLNLSPPPVPFDASVAVVFPIEFAED